MKAVVQRRYGSPDDLELRDVERPVPGPGEVLVRLRAASVHPDVWHVVRGWPYVLRLMGSGVRRPKVPIPGSDLAGVVETGGARFRAGDEVFGESVSGYSWHNGGAYAEYVAAPEAALARKPAAIGFEEAAALPSSGMIAISAVRDQARVRPGQRVLVNGAAGGVGMIAMQLAKAYGAEVTGVDSAAKLDLMRSLGADHVVDYTAEDFTRRPERYDALIDVASTRPFRELRRALAPSGKYVLIGHDQYGSAGARWLGSIPRFVRLMARTPFTDQLPNLDFSMRDKTAGMAHLAELVEAGKLRVAVDRTFPLGEVPAALRYLEAGHARGKVVIVCPSGSPPFVS